MTLPLDQLTGLGYAFTFPNMQPFSARAGIGYQDLLEDMRHYLVRTLIPTVQDLPAGLQGQLDTATASIAATVNTALDAAVAQVIAGENVPLNDATIHAVLQTAGSTALALLDGRYGKLRLEGAGFDPTGAADSSDAINAVLAAAAPGSTIVVPEGVVYRVTKQIVVPVQVRLTGGGELRWMAGENAMIAVRADSCHIDGLYLTNPAGAPISGIYVYANNVRVTGNRIVGFRDGICVSELGEYYNTVIAYNHVLDVIGSGTGPVNGDWGSGESNGDGIVSWGAATVIVGNRVTARAGSDARIGIHVEAISRWAVAGFSPDSLAVISGNLVSGPFRRSITSEGVSESAITGNVVHGFTFWGINVVGYTKNIVVANNVIKKTTGHANPTGSVHTGILLYCIQYAQENVNVTDNTIYVAAGAYVDNGITVNNDPSVQTLGILHSRIAGNSVTDDSNTLGDGIHVSPGSDSLEITGNRIYRFGVAGVRVNQGTRVDVSRNHLYGRGTASGVLGVALEGGAAEAIVDGNFVRDIETGIRAYFRSETLAVRGNVIRNATNGVDLYGSVSGLAALLATNLLSTVANPLVNAPAGVVLA